MHGGVLDDLVSEFSEYLVIPRQWLSFHLHFTGYPTFLCLLFISSVLQVENPGLLISRKAWFLGLVD